MATLAARAGRVAVPSVRHRPPPRNGLRTLAFTRARFPRMLAVVDSTTPFDLRLVTGGASPIDDLPILPDQRTGPGGGGR